MDILVSRTLYMSCQAGPGIEPGPSALKASALPIELTWQCYLCMFTSLHRYTRMIWTLVLLCFMETPHILIHLIIYIPLSNFYPTSAKMDIVSLT